MWYAASEIVFFLIVATAIGGLVGYGIGQIYQLDFGDLRAALASRRNQSEALAEARVEIADLRRKLDLTTQALRGDAASPSTAHPTPTAFHVEDTESGDADDSFPETGSTAHLDVPATSTDASSGRRLSERVADAERS